MTENFKRVIRKLERDFEKYKDHILEKEDLSKEELRILLKKLKDKKIPSKEIAHVISLFGESAFLEARDEVEKYLNSDDEVIRYNVITALVLDWGLEEHYETAIKLLKDPDEDVRSRAIVCIGSLKKNTGDKKTLSILLNIFKRSKDDWFIKDSAYFAILDVVGVSKDKRPPYDKKLDDKKDIDWKLIKKIEEGLKKR